MLCPWHRMDPTDMKSEVFIIVKKSEPFCIKRQHHSSFWQSCSGFEPRKLGVSCPTGFIACAVSPQNLLATKHVLCFRMFVSRFRNAKQFAHKDTLMQAQIMLTFRRQWVHARMDLPKDGANNCHCDWSRMPFLVDNVIAIVLDMWWLRFLNLTRVWWCC